jgi:glycosyltransferase involved in cell wall biosynthesis
MPEMDIDIVIPVWNRPVDTRTCLVNLSEYTPNARLILVNNGGDRETESILEEFAEGLDERALLISTPVNLGFVKAVNWGLARAEAEFSAVVRCTSTVSAGWLDPLLALARSRSEAGVIVPHLIPVPLKKAVNRSPFSDAAVEVSHGDFAAMLVRTDLHKRIGGFDEEMDGGKWCLKDYSRHALRKGGLTFAAAGSPVVFCDAPPLGSISRREEVLKRSIAAYTSRWGKERTFCIHFPKEAAADFVRKKFEVILCGARQGHSFNVLVFPAIYRELDRSGYRTLHRNITLDKLPRLFTAGRTKRVAASFRAVAPDLVLVAGFEGVSFPGGEGSISFAELELLIAAVEAEKYGRNPFSRTLQS